MIRRSHLSDKILRALAAAWTTTMAATALFVAALALSRVWDAGVFFRVMRTTILDP
jgi:hypothetical protein